MWDGQAHALYFCKAKVVECFSSFAQIKAKLDLQCLLLFFFRQNKPLASAACAKVQGRYVLYIKILADLSNLARYGWQSTTPVKVKLEVLSTAVVSWARQRTVSTTMAVLVGSGMEEQRRRAEKLVIAGDGLKSQLRSG